MNIDESIGIDIPKLQELVGSSFFCIDAHNIDIDADQFIIRTAGVSIEWKDKCWLHFASDWWEDSKKEDYFKLNLFDNNSRMHPSISVGATNRVRFAPQESEESITQIFFHNRGKLKEIEIYRGSPIKNNISGISDSLLVFRHNKKDTFGMMPIFLPWGYFQLTFSESVINEWKTDYKIIKTIK